MTATTLATSAASVSTTVTPFFALADARLRLFTTKDDYLAFKSAWKLLTKSGLKLSSSFFAAHAILTGHDLYKAFSPNGSHSAAPFEALADAIRLLGHLPNYAVSFKQIEAVLAAEQALVLTTAFSRAGDMTLALRTAPSRQEDFQAISLGLASFPPLPSPTELEGA